MAVNDFIPPDLNMDYDDIYESESMEDLEDCNPLKYIMDRIRENGDWPAWADNYTKFVMVKRVVGSFKGSF
ncbi:MAG TPA: hypothetical protein PK024_08515 [Methanospirillum sp.]|nr:hypothetical protein [Methanospirillum sp.]HPP76868.1 hypothetical protein [Methanospirillum sp.]